VATVGGEGWKALLSLFKANSRNELVALLGFSKAEIAARVAKAVENLKSATDAKASHEDDAIFAAKRHESVVSFTEPESQEVPSEPSDEEDSSALIRPDSQTPSEISAGVTSDTANAVLEEESTRTAPSLFGEDFPGTPQHDFSTPLASPRGMASHILCSFHIPTTGWTRLLQPPWAQAHRL